MQMAAATSNSNSSGNPDNSATWNPMTMSDAALLQRQKDVIKMQDNMLLDIEKGVDRLHIQVSCSAFL